MTGPETYPLLLTADLDQPLSRWLWLVTWILVNETRTVAHASLV